MARISHLFVAIAFLIIVSTFLLLLKDMDFSNFLPVFEIPLKKFIQGTHIVSAIPFGEIVVFLMITNALNNTRHTVRNILLGLLLGAISLLVISVRNTAVLGSTEAILASPSFQAARLIDIGRVITRMDLLIGIGHTIMPFLKCSIFYYAAVVSLSQLLRLRTYIPLILPIAGIVIILSAIVYESTVEHAMTGQSTSIIFVSPLLYIFPPLSLLIARIRNLPKQGDDKRQ